MMSNQFSIINHTDDGISPPGEVPFVDIKETVLGPEYDLSLVFVEDDEAQKLNEQHRNKSYCPNVLSFPVDEEMGEIFINLDAVNREHDDYNRNPEDFIAFLFIHGLHHLKGYAHGSTMEKAEADIRRKFGIK